MIEKHILKTIKIDGTIISNGIKRRAVSIPIVTEILVKYFCNIYFITSYNNKKSIVWDFKELEKQKRGIFKEYKYPQKFTCIDKNYWFVKLPKNKQILSKVVASGEFSAGTALFATLSNSENEKSQLQKLTNTFHYMPLELHSYEYIMQGDHGGEIIGWINPSIKEEELDTFMQKTLKKVVDVDLEDDYFPYAYYNSKSHLM